MSLEVDPSTRAVLEHHLWAGEELLWGERPGSIGAVAAQGARRALRNSITAVGTAMAILLYVSFKLDVWRGIHPSLLAIYGIPAVFMFGGVGIAAALGWWRARRSAPDVVYGLTTRRVLVVRGDSVEWIGDKELEGVEGRDDGVVVTRRRAEIEYQWAPDDLAQDSGARLARAQELDRRQLALVSLRDPGGVERLIRSTLRP